jgi:hypothetical protein
MRAISIASPNQLGQHRFTAAKHLKIGGKAPERARLSAKRSQKETKNARKKGINHHFHSELCPRPAFLKIAL